MHAFNQQIGGNKGQLAFVIDHGCIVANAIKRCFCSPG